MAKKVLIIGSGLGGLATALRLTTEGYEVEIVEKYHQTGGRLNRKEIDGFTFDTGPSFFSMSYEFDELFRSCGVDNPLKIEKLDPIYRVFFRDKKPFDISTNIGQLAAEFEAVEPHFRENVDRYLNGARSLFHSTEDTVVKKNYRNKIDYLFQLMKVPPTLLPYLTKSMWGNLEKHFQSEEAKIIFSLVAFFLGSTPFNTPAIYSLLNYMELEHNGYWNVKGGMYEIARQVTKILKDRGVKFHFERTIEGIENQNGTVDAFVDQFGERWKADLYVVNADAASFRGLILNRSKYNVSKLDKLQWTLAPFTIYLGLDKKLKTTAHHNYFLGDNFKEYADKIFKSSISPKRPYYYVNVSSHFNPDCAPEGCENVFVLCPVPDLRYKNNWDDKELLAENIIADLSQRVGLEIPKHTIVKQIWTPNDWADKFNLYRGSGLGLAHGLGQVGAFRPSNKDEHFKNLYYVGASTTPGTGLPMVVIGSKLVTERILNDG